MKPFRFVARISGNKNRVIYIPQSEHSRIPKTEKQVMITVEEIV